MWIAVAVALAEDGGPSVPPKVMLSGLEASYPLHGPLAFQVTYQDEHGLDLDSIGSDNFQIRPREVDETAREFLFGHRIQLTQLNAQDDGCWAEATYEVVSVIDVARPFFVSRLEPGAHEIQLLPHKVRDVDGLFAQTTLLGSFEVEGELPPLPDMTLSGLSVNRTSQGYVANIELEIPEGMQSFVSVDTGEQMGNRYVIDLQVKHLNPAVGFSEADQVPSGFSSRPTVTHSIGFLDPASYQIVVRLRGEEVGTLEFIAAPARESELTPYSGLLVTREAGGRLVADFTLPLPSHLTVRDWGSPYVDQPIGWPRGYRIDFDLAPSLSDGEEPTTPSHRYEWALDVPDALVVFVYHHDTVLAAAAIDREDQATVTFQEIPARLHAEDLNEATDQGHEFIIVWTLTDDVDMDFLKALRVYTVPHHWGSGFKDARVIGARPLNGPDPQVEIRYTVDSPWGDWDYLDNGHYQVHYQLAWDGESKAVQVGSGFSVNIAEPVPGIILPKDLPPLEDVLSFLPVPVSVLMSDSDGDGTTWVEEQFFQTDPDDPLSRAHPVVMLREMDGKQHLSLQYRRFKSGIFAGKILVSKDLRDWELGDDLVIFESTELDDYIAVTATMKASIADSDHRFISVAVVNGTPGR